MAGSIWGEVFRVSTWGESHGEGVGVVVDGAPAGFPFRRRYTKMSRQKKTGRDEIFDARKEGDKVKIMSGVFEGKTTGTPISMVVVNTSQKSGDYSNIANVFRPGHADFTFDAKYGFRDYRGGGRSSGRETIGRVASRCYCHENFKPAWSYRNCLHKADWTICMRGRKDVFG